MSYLKPLLVEPVEGVGLVSVELLDGADVRGSLPAVCVAALTKGSGMIAGL